MKHGDFTAMLVYSLSLSLSSLLEGSIYGATIQNQGFLQLFPPFNSELQVRSTLRLFLGSRLRHEGWAT